MALLVLCLAALVSSAVLTGVYRGYALRRRILDVPNARSSHVVPTPRGGGVAIVVSFLVFLCTARHSFGASGSGLAAIVGAGGSMALLGLIDDHRHVPAGWRLLGHFAAAVWALACIGHDWIPGFFGGGQLAIVIGYFTAALGIVWLLNLYNFMDGIDGIAGLETITVCIPATLLWFLVRAEGPWLAPLLLAACAAGFLVWNFPPARIFMGDVGSNFLGVVLAVLAMSAAAVDTRLLWAWGILLGAFIVDATVTLLRRLSRRERVHEAHRSHAYQHAARRYGHRRVALAASAINLAWLFPLAGAVALGRLSGLLGIILAYAPLVWLVLRFNAGALEAQAARGRAE